jgi:hypothetical protein
VHAWNAKKQASKQTSKQTYKHTNKQRNSLHGAQSTILENLTGPLLVNKLQPFMDSKLASALQQTEHHILLQYPTNALDYKL